MTKKATKKTAAKNDAKTPASGPKQLKIPGTERKKIADVEAAAEAYRAVRDKRMELGKQEREKKKLLADCVQKHGITKYVYEDDDGRELEVDLKSKTNVTVRRVKDEDDDQDGEE